MNNLGARLSELGRRTEALEPTQEAVTLYRELAADNPAYLNDLAMSLNNLGIRLSELGRRTEALEPTQEAVTLRRELAADNPAYLNDLAGSLNNLSIRLSELGRGDEAPPAWLECSADLDAPADGWLLAQATGSDTLEATERNPLARQALAGLRHDADGQGRLLGEGRRALAAAVEEHHLALDDVDPPRWLAVAPTEADYELANAWEHASHGSFDELAQAGASWITDNAAHERLHSLAERFPGTRFATEWTMVAEHPGGITEAVAALVENDRASHLLNQWISTDTWEASQAFYEANHEPLTGELPQALLQQAVEQGQALAAQHLALIGLCEAVGPDIAFGGAADAAAALTAANRAVAEGRLDLVMSWAAANPRLLQRPPDGVLIQALLLLLQQPDAAAEHPEIGETIQAVYADARNVQRDNARARLTKLAAHDQHQDLANRLLTWIDEAQPPPVETLPDRHQ
ncbi:MAG: tetratricopeptide repeat protein [Microthrixaceae bacterium]